MTISVCNLDERLIAHSYHCITVLTNSKGFAIVFNGNTIIVASLFGIIVSSAHPVTGCISINGLEKGIHKVNFGIILRLFVIWLDTVPLSKIFAIVIFKFFYKLHQFLQNII